METVLVGKRIIVGTDHKPLQHLLEQRFYTEAQHTWLLKLLNYKYVVEYKKERDNVTADSLTRRDETDSSPIFETEYASLVTLVAVESNWLSQVRKMVEIDDFFKSFVTPRFSKYVKTELR